MSNNNKIEKPSLEFQIYDWVEDHYIQKNSEASGSDDKNKIGEYIIHVFGRMLDGQSVYAKIEGFTPYFYIELPNEWYNYTETKINLQLDDLKKYLTGNFNKKIWTKFKSTLIDIKYLSAKKADSFTNDSNFKFARLTFNNSDGMKKFRVYFEENEVSINFSKPQKFKTYEANLPPMFRCFHNRNISGCSWVETSKYTNIKKQSLKESHCDIELNINWKDLNYLNKDTNAPLRIASFDIECFSHDGQFPQANRKQDQIIQIGVTYTYLGQSEPYRQYIGCLNETTKFDETTDLRSFDNETDLIMDFKDELIRSDADIITGYNIFYFDEKYIYDRCDTVLGIKEEMAFLSKLKNKPCNFKEMKLASSALGENLLRFWDTPGRVHIDLMKDVQKTFNLPSFKLDFVASNFIRGEVKNFNMITDDKLNKFKKNKDNLLIQLECASVDDISLQDYIHLEAIKGFVSDEVGEKYIVADIDKTNKTLVVIGDSFLEKELQSAKDGGKVFWSQAKDDVGPKEIFKFFKGTPEQRSIVAKYCIKDCKLVNLLMNKLEVVTKSIEMANVCSVPLSYLFIRGQGIKIFSLCLKEFKEQGFIFPVIKMNKAKLCKNCNIETKGYNCPKCKGRDLEDIESNDTYEGAIVFDPVATVDYEANVTKDYNSLYPSAIIQKNMSHETIVEKPEYDNLPDVKYYDAQYIEADGSIQYRRFAQKNNKLGVIPMILDKLLKERKAVKKQMEGEKNVFKKKILDAKQLALKVTANSLYGQLGAPTSPVCKKDIAACTTSTGREMLILGKKYDEEILPWLMNGMKKALEREDEETFNKLLDLELKNKDNKSFIENLKKYLLEDLRCKTIQPVVRYGDSVIGDTPLLLRNKKTKNILIKSINEISNNWIKMDEKGKEEKESSEINDFEIWTEKGWTNIKRVIRHKLNQDKKLLRITTHSGSVVVTDEHSLLNDKGDKVIPSKLKIGDALLTSFPNFENVFNDVKVKEFSIKMRNLMNTENKHKIVPEIILNSSKEIREAFWIGLYNKKCRKQIDQKGCVAAMSIYTLAKSLGYQVSINVRSDKTDIYRIRVVDKLRKKENLIKKIEPWKKSEEYVYDLTTENHHFQAGVGNIIVHNTDSNFSCYRIREDVTKVDKEEALILWKEIVNFSKELIKPFIPEEHQKKWIELHEQYYGADKIKFLRLPNGPDVIPDQGNIILPIEDRLKQFLKEYMEESYLPWLWSLQEVVLRHFKNIDYKLCQWGQYQLSKIRLTGNDLSDEKIKGYADRMKQIDTQIKKENEKIKKEKKAEALKEKDYLPIEESHETIISDAEQIVEKTVENVISPQDTIDTLLKEREGHQKNYQVLFEERQVIETLVKNFSNNILKDNWIQPYWIIKNDKIVHRVEFYKGGKMLTDKRSLELSMEIGKLSGELIRSRLPFPHNFAYEKTFWPFMILCKKKYVGNKYEDNPNKYKQDFMGIVLKRRDNSPIVKEVCGGIIDMLINKRDPEGAKLFLRKCLEDMFAGKYDIKYFMQSRTLKLKESYKDWTRIGHVFLSEKIAQRDPGNKPQSGDRIEFVVIKVPNDDPKKKFLQGEIIETPAYIKQNNSEIDYLFYMTNQIQKPATQFLELVDDKIEELFDEFIVKYGKPKAVREKKEKVIPEKKPRVPRKKIIKIETPAVLEEPIIEVEEVKIKKSKKKVIEEKLVEEELIVEEVKIKKKKNKVVEEEPIIEELVVEEVKIKKSKKKVVEEPVVEELVEEVKIKKKKNKVENIEV